jgi:integrase
VLDQAEKEMLVPYNAASKASPPKTKQKEVNYFQPEAVTAILDALEQEPIKWRTITHLMLVTGCRRAEVMGLKWDKIDFDNAKAKIERTLLYPGCWNL